ncbi:FAD/NAD(P)-binding domain-containing protein [Hypoxylon sp. FL1284]|nr:FAD/NAD(P)-binding domain-containing protein [Hypoxylon sp. FL1284]
MAETSKPGVVLDVIVVGAGISGLAAAIETALSGHHVTVYEAADGLHEIGAGIQVTPNAARILQRWDLSDEFWATLAEPTRYGIRRYAGEVLMMEERFDATMRGRYGAPFIEPHRIDYQRALYSRARALGVAVRFGARVASVNFLTGELVVAPSGEKTRGDLVVAADGLWSALRAQLHPRDLAGVPRPTGDLAYRLVLTLDQLADLELREWVRNPTCNLWLGPRSHVIGYSLRGGAEFNLVLITPDDLPSGVSRQAASVDEMRALFKDWDPILNRFLSVVSSVRKWKLMHRAEMRKWVHDSQHGKFVFVGDSCHPMLPYLGQGANVAVEDGAVLGRLLKYIQTKDQLSKVLEMYEKLRKPRGDAIAKETFGQRVDFHMIDGPEQEKRDAFLRSPTEGVLHPMRWACPIFQPWLFGYDAHAEVDKAVKEDPFV